MPRANHPIVKDAQPGYLGTHTRPQTGEGFGPFAEASGTYARCVVELPYG
jgi:hypothetical protein